MATDGTKLDGIETNAINASNTAITNKLPLAGGTLTGNVIHNDNVKALFGTGSDLQIYYSGTHAIIDNVNGGDFLNKTVR